MKLPLLISVPHAGLRVPEQIAAINLLTPDQIAQDGDLGAGELYAIADHVQTFIQADIARAFVDLNRAETDRRADGVVKTHTVFQEPIYSRPLADREIEDLLERYWRPYHRRLREAAHGVLLGLDCHTMLAQAPPIGPDPGTPRPPVCISNAEATCPTAWLQTLADCLRETLGLEVAQNRPFRGGHIIRAHAHEAPWIQVEFSRGLRMSHDKKRDCLLRALDCFLARVT